jgi:hypothetical protein
MLLNSILILKTSVDFCFLELFKTLFKSPERLFEFKSMIGLLELLSPTLISSESIEFFISLIASHILLKYF